MGQIAKGQQPKTLPDLQIVKAKKENLFVRMGICGPAGSGKSYTAIEIATELGRTLVIDTEFGSTRHYADSFDFDIITLDEFTTQHLQAAFLAAHENGYQCVVVDSFSHFWNGLGGVHDIVDDLNRQDIAKGKTPNTMLNWGTAKMEYRYQIELIQRCPLHVICTFRSATDYEKDASGKRGFQVVGLKPVHNDGIDYEFDAFAMMQNLGQDVQLSFSKTRCESLQGKIYRNPKGADFHDYFKWLNLI